MNKEYKRKQVYFALFLSAFKWFGSWEKYDAFNPALKANVDLQLTNRHDLLQ